MLDWANDGEDQCGLHTNDCKPNPEYSQCILYPQANFLWFTTANFNNYLGNMYGSIGPINSVLTDWTGTMVTQFFTAQTVRLRVHQCKSFILSLF